MGVLKILALKSRGPKKSRHLKWLIKKTAAKFAKKKRKHPREKEL
jgi:hypothetical protein